MKGGRARYGRQLLVLARDFAVAAMIAAAVVLVGSRVNPPSRDDRLDPPIDPLLQRNIADAKIDLEDFKTAVESLGKAAGVPVVFSGTFLDGGPGNILPEHIDGRAPFIQLHNVPLGQAMKMVADRFQSSYIRCSVSLLDGKLVAAPQEDVADSYGNPLKMKAIYGTRAFGSPHVPRLYDLSDILGERRRWLRRVAAQTNASPGTVETSLGHSIRALVGHCAPADLFGRVPVVTSQMIPWGDWMLHNGTGHWEFQRLVNLLRYSAAAREEKR